MISLRMAGAVALMSAALGVPAADGRASEQPPGAQAIKQRASDLINRAQRRVRHAEKACRLGPPSGRLLLGDGGAGPVVLSVLGVFRRPATPEEQALAVQEVADPFGSSSYGDATVPRDGVRIVRQGDRKVVLTALREVPPSGPDRATYDRCTALVAHELARLAPTVTPAVAAKARHVEHVLRRTGRPPAHQARTEGLTIAERAGNGTSTESGILSLDPVLFRRTGTAEGSFARGGRLRMTFVVPDGVATIDATFPRARHGAPGHPGKRFATTIRRTLVVHDNVAFLTVHRPPEALPRMVWRAADGSVVRRLPGS
jgi:hypothetical protein